MKKNKKREGYLMVLSLLMDRYLSSFCSFCSYNRDISLSAAVIVTWPTVTFWTV